MEALKQRRQTSCSYEIRASWHACNGSLVLLIPLSELSNVCVFFTLQVNLAIMQKQLSEMAIGHPRQPGSSSRQNGFSGGVGALGIMNNRLAETSVDR